MAVSTVSAASDDIASDSDTSLALNDNAIEKYGKICFQSR